MYSYLYKQVFILRKYCFPGIYVFSMGRLARPGAVVASDFQVKP